MTIIDAQRGRGGKRGGKKYNNGNGGGRRRRGRGRGNRK